MGIAAGRGQFRTQTPYRNERVAGGRLLGVEHLNVPAVFAIMSCRLVAFPRPADYQRECPVCEQNRKVTGAPPIGAIDP